MPSFISVSKKINFFTLIKLDTNFLQSFKDKSLLQINTQCLKFKVYNIKDFFLFFLPSKLHLAVKDDLKFYSFAVRLLQKKEIVLI